MKAFLLALPLAAAFGAGTPATSLSITSTSGAPGVRPVHLVLACTATSGSGTVPHPTAACRRLLRLADPFAPAPPGACGMLALPGRAAIAGRLRGRPVHVILTRITTCQLARWQRVSFLLPAP
jgi:hypothetical protein